MIRVNKKIYSHKQICCIFVFLLLICVTPFFGTNEWIRCDESTNSVDFLDIEDNPSGGYNITSYTKGFEKTNIITPGTGIEYKWTDQPRSKNTDQTKDGTIICSNPLLLVFYKSGQLSIFFYNIRSYPRFIVVYKNGEFNLYHQNTEKEFEDLRNQSMHNILKDNTVDNIKASCVY